MSSLHVSQLRRGDTRDVEDWHASHRLLLAHSILRENGVTWKTEHGNTAINETVEWGRVKHACADNCRTWIEQEWVTDQIIEAAWHLADLLQTERGAWHRRQAWEAKQAAV